ncbi:hypothetical protein OS493_001167 [Desmophyllum pertusum]|uniref:Rho termination factor-like N-terminal domain-containing protein n=1 Tax=Desmophyllum pertusum TaxID=174260 RepID=A0A9X0CYX7_9CNID|nr:hypothetical protein OS493_007036 [Desmophyllum pertusum]KAJ7387821.1 hypothetical protein OS493_001167 [Desmophyllum pertusum]
MDYTTLKCKNLTKICKERKIKYATKMRKQEMIEILKWNDENNTVKIHFLARKRILDYMNKYRNNESVREKARECSKRWRINNPEKARENWIKFNTEYNLFPLENDSKTYLSTEEEPVQANPEKAREYWVKLMTEY